MQIEKNIAATLKNEMEKRGGTLMEFSLELGIPRSTLQGYLKGTSHPRADSLEELAEKLGISVAELVSGTEYAGGAGMSCLEPIRLEMQGFHPQAQALAREALSLLRTAFRVSDELNGIDPLWNAPEKPDDTYHYCLYEMWDPFCGTHVYGILGKKRSVHGWVTVAVAAPFSRDRTAVARLTKRCTELQISPVHILDVIHDFLAQEDSTL